MVSYQLSSVAMKNLCKEEQEYFCRSHPSIGLLKWVAFKNTLHKKEQKHLKT